MNPDNRDTERSRKESAGMTLDRVIHILEADILVNVGHMDMEIDSVCNSDLMSDLLHFATKPRSLLITGLSNTQVVRTAEIADIKAIVFVLDKRPDKETMELARQKAIPLLVTRLSRFTSCGRLFAAGLRSCSEEAR